MLVHDSATLLESLVKGYAHPTLASGPVTAAVAGLLKNKGFAAHDEAAVLLACMAASDSGGLRQSLPKDIADKRQVAGQMLMTVLTEKLEARRVNPPTPAVAVHPSWADLQPLENAIRSIHAFRSAAEATGERGVYVVTLATPEQLARPLKNTVCPGLDVPVFSHALVGTQTGFHTYLEGIRECVTKCGYRTAGGNMLALLVGPHWPADVDLGPDSTMQGVEVLNGGGGALGAIIKFEAVGPAAMVIQHFTQRYLELFPSSREMWTAGRAGVPIFLSTVGIPPPIQATFMYALNVGAGRISDKTLVQTARAAVASAANANRAGLESGKALIVRLSIELTQGADEHSWVQMVTTKEIGAHALGAKVESKELTWVEVKQAEVETLLWCYAGIGVEGSPAQIKAIKEVVASRARIAAASLVYIDPNGGKDRFVAFRGTIEGIIVFKCASQAYAERAIGLSDNGKFVLTEQENTAMMLSGQDVMLLSHTAKLMETICEAHGVDYTKKKKRGESVSGGADQKQVDSMKAELESMRVTATREAAAREEREKAIDERRVEDQAAMQQQREADREAFEKAFADAAMKQEKQHQEQMQAQAEQAQQLSRAMGQAQALIGGLLATVPESQRVAAIEFANNAHNQAPAPVHVAMPAAAPDVTLAPAPAAASVEEVRMEDVAGSPEDVAVGAPPRADEVLGSDDEEEAYVPTQPMAIGRMAATGGTTLDEEAEVDADLDAAIAAGIVTPMPAPHCRRSVLKGVASLVARAPRRVAFLLLLVGVGRTLADATAETDGGSGSQCIAYRGCAPFSHGHLTQQRAAWMHGRRWAGAFAEEAEKAGGSSGESAFAFSCLHEKQLQRCVHGRKQPIWTKVRRMHRQLGRQFASWVRGVRKREREGTCVARRSGSVLLLIACGTLGSGLLLWHVWRLGAAACAFLCSVTNGGGGCVATVVRRSVNTRAFWWLLMALQLGASEAVGLEGERMCSWNARNLAVSVTAAGGLYFSGIALKKLAFLAGRLRELRPAACALLELGVGGVRQKRFLARWVQQHGYKMKFMSGESVEGKWRNSMAVLYDKKQMQLDDSDGMSGAAALAERVLRVDLRRIDGECISVTAMHGKHDDRGFIEQVEALEGAYRRSKGGLIMADVNRRTCSMQCSSGRALGGGDAAWRGFVGCGCLCQGGLCGSAPDADLRGGELIPFDGEPGEQYTRWAMVRGKETWSVIDRAVAVGSEQGKWHLCEKVWAEDVTREGGLLADHAFMVWQRTINAACVAEAEQRWLAPRTAKWSRLDREAFAKRAGTVIKDLANGLLQGAEAVSEADAAVVAAAEVVEEERLARKEKGGDDAKAQLGQWRMRLEVARELVARPDMLYRDSRLMHSRCSLRSYILWAKKVGACKAETARALLRRCRREETFLVARLASEGRAAKRWMEKLLRNEAVTDPAIRAQLAFREMREFQESDKLAMVARKDDPSLGFYYTSVEVRKEVGAIGGQAQRDYVEENPAPAGAFEAFAAHFVGRCDELKAPDGSRFSLEQLLTFDLFQNELYAYARNKAVGAKVGGAASSLEFLRMLKEEHLREYFQWVKDCVVGRCLPAHWKCMVYTLLRKKHGDQRKVRKMREIALMDQTLKLMLKCVKRLSFDRMVGRTAESNKGWVPGHGALDAALIADCVLGQTRELKHDIYLLWLDLAQFFPSIKRRPRRYAEWLVGLPEDVALLATEVFRGMVAKIDTAHGLGDAYTILGGDLMGCVLSPDHARMVLIAVSVAIAAVSSGVKLWGCEAKARRIVQAMMADDWLGFNTSEASLREQWRVWVDYSLASGSPIGVAGLEKTVVAAGTYKGGRWVNVPVRLVIPQGEGGMKGAPATVPQLSVLQPYPHMGILRSICGSRKPFMAKLVKGAARLMSKVKRVRLDASQHVTCANCLKGAYVGYYAAPMGLTRREAERVEVGWRKAFNITFKRPRDAPRVGLYCGEAGVAGEALHGRHVLADAVASVRALCTKALAWPHDTDERAVARSALARRCRWWGCVSDPMEWLGSHEHCELADTIEAALDATGYCSEVFDYFILYEAWVAARARRLRNAESAEGRCLPPMRHAAEFVHDDDACGEALRGGGHSAWVNGGSPSLASLTTLRLSAALINAGVTRVEHMCRLAPGGARVVSYGEARVGHGLRACNGDRAAWEVMARVVDRALEEGLRIASIRRPLSARQLWDGARTLHGGGGGAGSDELLPALEGTRRLTAALQAARSKPCGATRQEAGARARDMRSIDWKALVESDYPNVTPRGTAEWNCGSPADSDRYGGVRIVNVWPGAGKRGTSDVGEVGGQRLWMPPEEEVARVRADCARWSVGFDGLACLDGTAAEPEAAEGLPAVQLMVRACIAIVAAGGVDNEGGVKSLPAGVWRVHRSGTEKMLGLVGGLQAEYGITHAAATDGGRQRIPVQCGSPGETRMAASYGGVLHDGSVVQGALDPYKQGRNSYLTEVIALIKLFRRLPTGARAMVIVDARSPVQALIKFRVAHVCKRAEYYEDELIDELLKEVERMAVVIFVWAKSHVGIAPNEVADLVATGALEEDAEWVGLGVCRHRSIRFRAERSVYSESAILMRGFVRDWLAGSSVNSIWREAGDWRLPYREGEVSGEEKRVLRLAQQGRLLPSDPARHRGEVGEMLRGRMCGCGAGGSCSTAHWLFDCQKREAVAARRLLCVEVKAAAREMEEGESRHEQSRALLRELQGEGRGDDRAEALRWVVGCVRKPPISGAAARKAALVVLKSAGTTLLVAEAMLKDDEEKAVKEVKARRAARRCGRKWRQLSIVQGPMRAAALAELWPGRAGARVRARRVGAKADWEEAAREWRAIRRLACWAAARREGLAALVAVAEAARCLEAKVRCCEEKGLTEIERARARASARKAEKCAEQELQAEAFKNMMGAPGQRGEPSLATGLVDVEVTFAKRQRRCASTGQRRRRATRGGGKRRRSGRLGAECDDGSECEQYEGESESSDAEGAEAGGSTRQRRCGGAGRRREGEGADAVGVGDELQVWWSDEQVWFGCEVRQRRLDEDGKWVHLVRYDVEGWPDCWHKLDSETWRRRSGDAGEEMADEREEDYAGDKWAGELDVEAAAAKAAAEVPGARAARLVEREKRMQEAAKEPTGEAKRRADYDRAVMLLDEMFEKSECLDELSERTWKRAAVAAKIGRGTAETVLRDADEQDMIMRRDGCIHLIGDLRGLRGRTREGDEDEEDDETR